MKTMKKLLSILMVLTLVLALGAQAFAATITIGGHHDLGSTYSAYELMTATYIRTDTIDGKSVDVYEYHIKDGMESVIAAGMAEVKDAGTPPTYANNVAEYERQVLEFLKGLDATQTRAFADAAFVKIGTDKIKPVKTVTVNNVDVDPVLEDLNGYYLIAETLASPDLESAVTSLVMLDTVGKGDFEIATKEDVPTSDKKVQERNNNSGELSGWQDAADYNVGDYVPFQLTAKIQNKGFDEYDKYYLEFVDALSKGLTFVNDVDHPLKVMLGETDVTDSFTVTSNGQSLSIKCEDVKKISGVVAGSTFTVTYYALLNEDAVRGVPGNPNSMHIVYSNNPNGDQDGTGHTPEKKVTVFTFDLKVDKVDGNEEPLAGAAFALLKEFTEVGADTSAATELPDISKEKSVTIEEGKFYYTEKDSVKTIYQAVKTIAAGETTTFKFEGLDSGKYLLVETTVPNGYNAIDPVEITITAVYNTTGNPPALESLTVTPDTFSANMNSGLIDGDIINQSGLELPETGGIGTTIFYVAGGILVAAAVILLVTRRRVSGAEK